MDFGGFIGRFHPLLVHLPIGMLLLAAMLEYFARKPKYKNLHKAVAITLFIGAFSAIFSSLSGWLLANRGAYIERSLFLHRWLGIAVAVFATLCWLVKSDRLRLSSGVFKTLLSLMLIGLFATGHFGGQMTHGDDYLLEYAPGFMKNMFGYEIKQEQVYDFENPKKIKVYDQLLAPLFETKCWKCHNPDNPLGSLDLTTEEAFIKGGLHGVVLEKGDAYQSEVFKRITMPVSDRKSMPPFGLALPYNDIRLIEWWINNGASFEKNIGEFDLPSDIKTLLNKEYGISFIEKSALEEIKVDTASLSDINLVEAAGFVVKNIAEDNNLLEVEIKTKGIALTNEQIELLLKIKEQVTWLSLPNSTITEAQLEKIGEFKNLTRLRLQNNPIDDIALQKIENLPVLESLNLIGSAISDQGIESVKKMNNLKSLYVFQTKITEEGIQALIKARPDLEVVKAFQFVEPE